MADTVLLLPWLRASRYRGNDLASTTLPSTSEKAIVAVLSASGSASSTGSMTVVPSSFRRAIDFCVAPSNMLLEDLICEISRSARRFDKKFIRVQNLRIPVYGTDQFVRPIPKPLADRRIMP